VPAAAIGGERTGTERPAGERTPAPVVARLDGVSARGPTGAEALRDVSIEVRRGEVVGVAGVEGNGQRELALALTGRLGVEVGTAEVPAGVGFIPQDRTVEGVVSDFDLVENVALALHDDARFTKRWWLRWDRIREEAEAVVARFGVVTPGVDARAGALSGGNQQRLVVGRELARATDLLVAENPTRGLDVRATAFVHGELRRLASSETGPGIVLVSTDLDEVLALATRLFVMARGRLVQVPADAGSREGVGALMLGGGGVGA
jgi:simple sugar transport system ATP-binding protein